MTNKREGQREKRSVLTYVRVEARKTPRFLHWCVYFGSPVPFTYTRKKSQ